MNKFDELMIMNSKLDAVLDDMKKANYHLENELMTKRDAAQKQMFDDIAVLRGYMRKVGMQNVELNTGIKTPWRDGTVMLIKISLVTTDIGLLTANIKSINNGSFHRWFDKDIPIAEAKMSWHNDYCKDYMYTIMKNWDVAYANLQNDLFDKLQEFMEEKAKKVTDKQSALVAALDDFDRKE